MGREERVGQDRYWKGKRAEKGEGRRKGEGGEKCAAFL